MKLLSIKQARSIWLMRLEDLNPHGYNLLSIVDAVAAQYRFLQYTKPEDIVATRGSGKGIVFMGGTFHKQSDIPIAVDLTVYNDGILADTNSSTDDSDSFLSELLSWITEKFRLTPYQELLKSQLYLSEVWVQTDKSLDAVNPKLQAFARKLGSLVANYSGRTIAFETSGMTIWNDRTIANPFGAFRFERAENAPFEENRYYSSAPLPTNMHLDMLEEFENILAG